MWARKHIRCQCVYQPTQATEPAASLALAVVILMLMFRQISFWLEKACSKELVLFTGGNLLGAFLSQEYAQFIARGRNLPRNQFESTIFQSIYQLMFPHKGTHVLPNTHTHTFSASGLQLQSSCGSSANIISVQNLSQHPGFKSCSAVQRMYREHGCSSGTTLDLEIKSKGFETMQRSASL